jgi:hypothetical protein
MRRLSLPPFISFCHCCVECKRGRIRRVKYWEIIADNLHDAGWSLGWVSAVDCEGRMISIVDAHRDDGQRFVVRAEEQLTAFLELESAIRANHPSSAAAPVIDDLTGASKVLADTSGFLKVASESHRSFDGELVCGELRFFMRLLK